MKSLLLRLLNITILLAVILLAGSSCCTLDRCIAKHPELSMQVLEDSTTIIDRIIYRDTVIRIPLKGDTSQVSYPVPWEKMVELTPWPEWFFPDSGQVVISHLQGKRSSSSISLARDTAGGRILHELLEPDTLIDDTIRKLDRHTTIDTRSKRTTQTVIETKYIPRFYKFTFWWFWASVTAIGGMLFWRVRKFWK